MRTKNAFRTVLTLFAFLALAAPFASAGVVTYSDWYPTLNGPLPSSTPQNWTLTDWNGVAQSVSLPQFDTQSGALILNSATLTLYTDINSSGDVQNDGGGSVTVNQYDVSLRVRIAAPGTSTPIILSTPFLIEDDPAMASILAGTILAPAQQQSFSVTQSSASNSASLSNLSLYEGTGTVTMPLFTTTRALADLSGGSLTVVQTTSGRAEATITYDYTPADAPEPASMLLMGFGLVGIGLLGRKRFAR
jgi:hypothetical protein